MEMKKIFRLITLSLIMAISCAKEEPAKICAQPCSSNTPWRVESLDLGLPCFRTKEDCLKWASSNGYNDKPCVTCN
jgi:hypothetical protein